MLLKLNNLTPVKQQYYKSGLLMWGLLLGSTAGMIIALAAALNPKELPFIRKYNDVILGLSSIGLVSHFLKHRREQDVRVFHADWNEEERRIHLERKAIHNPYDTINEKGRITSEIGSTIASVLREQGLSRVSYAGETLLPTSVRYFFNWEGFGSASTFSNDKTVTMLRHYLKLPNHPDGKPLGLTINPTDSLSGKLLVDIEMAKNDPRRVVPMLTDYLSYNAGVMTSLIGFDAARNSLRVVDIERDEYDSELITGSTGSGKSVALQVKAKWIVCRHTEDEARIILVDLKNPGSSACWHKDWELLPHTMRPVVTTEGEVYELLHIIEGMRQARVDYLVGLYNKGDIPEPSMKALNRVYPQTMPRIFVFMDEPANMPSASGKFESPTLWDEQIVELSRQTRSVGINFIFGFQRSTSDDLDIRLRDNCSTRIAMKTNNLTSAPVALDAGDPFENPVAASVAQMSQSLAGNGEMIMLDGGVIEKYYGLFDNTSVFNLPIKTNSEIKVRTTLEMLGSEVRFMSRIANRYDFDMKYKEIAELHGHKPSKGVLAAMSQRLNNFIDVAYEAIHEENEYPILEESVPPEEMKILAEAAKCIEYKEMLQGWFQFCREIDNPTITNFFKNQTGNHSDLSKKYSQAIKSEAAEPYIYYLVYSGCSKERLMSAFFGESWKQREMKNKEGWLKFFDLKIQQFMKNRDEIIQSLIAQEMLPEGSE